MNSYYAKDQRKFAHCTHLQSYGVKGSSSYNYASLFPELSHDLHSIDSTSKVGLSSNGDRPDRIPFPIMILEFLYQTHCTIITDNNYHRARNYNLGEREIAQWLQQHHYHYTDYLTHGEWTYASH